MPEQKITLLTDEFLDDLAKEINELYGVPIEERKEQDHREKQTRR